MTKEENIFNLYDLLENNGQKGNAQAFISELTGVKRSTIKANWFCYRELPERIKNDDRILNSIINYLQKQNYENNRKNS